MNNRTGFYAFGNPPDAPGAWNEGKRIAFVHIDDFNRVKKASDFERDTLFEAVLKKYEKAGHVLNRHTVKEVFKALLE